MNPRAENALVRLLLTGDPFTGNPEAGGEAGGRGADNHNTPETSDADKPSIPAPRPAHSPPTEEDRP